LQNVQQSKSGHCGGLDVGASGYFRSGQSFAHPKAEGVISQNIITKT
jgi:hypothetical protein